jgi:N-acetyl-anhydromuramyl-L-alanine amidase AmpD
MNIIDVELQFIESHLEGHEPESILITHSKIPFSTVFDSHIEGLTGNKGGAECHYFVDKVGDIYKGRDDKFGNGSIVICLEGDVDADPVGEKQLESVIELCVKLVDEYNIADVNANVNDSGIFFPVNEIEDLFGKSSSEEVTEEE